MVIDSDLEIEKFHVLRARIEPYELDEPASIFSFANRLARASLE